MRQCKQCGGLIANHRHKLTLYCSKACAEEMYKRNRKRKPRPSRAKEKRIVIRKPVVRGVWVIDDPDKVGGFKCGANFSVAMTRETLGMGHFTLGTELWLSRGVRGWKSRGRYKVIVNPKYYQRKTHGKQVLEAV